ncbi:MAG: sulfotransferase domain-containing protein [Candidatus Acidiferrum sp.]
MPNVILRHVTTSILQAGFPKSGNFWLWNIIESSLRQAGIPNRSYVRKRPIYRLAKHWKLAFKGQAGMDFLRILPEGQWYTILPVFYWPIPDLKAYVRASSHVWTHDPIFNETVSTFRLFSKIVYLIRDPRDIALAAQRFYGNDFMRKFAGSYGNNQRIPDREWGNNVASFLRRQKELRVHIVFYERLLWQWESEYDRLLDYLDLRLTDRKKEAVRRVASFAEMKKGSPLHLNRGKAYTWVGQMDLSEQEKFSRFFAPFLEFLGYPRRASQAASHPIPKLPSPGEFQRQLKRAISSWDRLHS